MKNRIRECRKAAGISQTELSNVLGVSFVSISRYERGLSEPNLATWERLAKALHVSPAYLVGWSNKPKHMTINVPKGGTLTIFN
ncbi:helix-turn-helix domain-containing protein [Limosilactobacillus vaginalis]|uniref:helix-turn-helix domain-containing protein n=1 Tax=Limosilactobacillus vaginalis TaxID=1633 RepID=UPI00288AC230|nr:helix-turn-helix transcriptional regulator [Limosilactobacillus vaginalis]